jgi:hypothetical protein
MTSGDYVEFTGVWVRRALDDVSYSTICLPFDLTSLEGTPYQGATVLKLVDSEAKNEDGDNRVFLNFAQVSFEGDDYMHGGVPYLIQLKSDQTTTATDDLIFNDVRCPKFTTTPNTGTTERSCTIKVTQENGTDSVDIVVKQGGAPAPPPQEDPCMTISYSVGGGITGCDVYFKTTNGTQQGSHSNVSASGNKTLCNIPEETEIVVTCSCADVIVGGDTSFTFYSGQTASISLSKDEPEPVVTGFKIANNQPGVAKIYMKDTYGNMIDMKLPDGTTVREKTLNKDVEQTFTDVFTTTTNIYIEYERGQWQKDNFLVVDFEGSNLSPYPSAKNNIDISEQGIEGYRIFPRVTDACSGTLTCPNHDYNINVNFIFK